MLEIIFSPNKKVLPLTSLALVLFVALVLTSPVLLRASDLSVETILQLVNTDRAAQGLKSLQLNTDLNEAAQAKLDDMFEAGYFSHTSPKGETPWFWVKQSGYHYQYAGENLAINYATAESQHKAWMKSATHRANILNDKYQETGIAVKTGKMNGETVTITVQMFGAPRITSATRTPQPSALPETSQSTVPAPSSELALVLPLPQSLPVVPNESSLAPVQTGPVIALNDSTHQSDNYFQWSPELLVLAMLVAMALLAFVAVMAPALFVFQALKQLYAFSRQSKPIASH